MLNLNSALVREFLTRLGQRHSSPAQLYLIGGAALCLLGSPRSTLDLDYIGDDLAKNKNALQRSIEAVAAEMQLDVEAVPLEQFIPLPDGAQERTRLIDTFGAITVSIFDPYSIALSKLARGFDTDIEDIVFLIQHNFIAVGELEAITAKALLQGREFDMMPGEVRQNFKAVYRRLASVT